MKLSGKAAVITGSSVGVGRAAAVAFAERGCAVVINYNHSQSEAEEAAALCRERAEIDRGRRDDPASSWRSPGSHRSWGFEGSEQPPRQSGIQSFGWDSRHSSPPAVPGTSSSNTA